MTGATNTTGPVFALDRGRRSIGSRGQGAPSARVPGTAPGCPRRGFSGIGVWVFTSGRADGPQTATATSSCDSTACPWLLWMISSHSERYSLAKRGVYLSLKDFGLRSFSDARGSGAQGPANDAALRGAVRRDEGTKMCQLGAYIKCANLVYF
jgi:hypothetical protein